MLSSSLDDGHYKSPGACEYISEWPTRPTSTRIKDPIPRPIMTVPNLSAITRSLMRHPRPHAPSHPVSNHTSEMAQFLNP